MKSIKNFIDLFLCSTRLKRLEKVDTTATEETSKECKIILEKLKDNNEANN